MSLGIGDEEVKEDFKRWDQKREEREARANGAAHKSDEEDDNPLTEDSQASLGQRR
jgi:hypothetical protein